VLPASPLGPLLALTALPLEYYLLLTIVLALYAARLVHARKRHERGPVRCGQSGRFLEIPGAGAGVGVRKWGQCVPGTSGA
jgi:hypothetical protein